MAVEEIIDRLYGLAPAEFVQARNEAARELRQAGEREAADRVKALPKPTAAAAAVNRLVREHRGEVERFLHAAAVLRDAQFGGKGDLAAATEQERGELERLIRAAGGGVRQTLLAAAADEDAAQRLLEARLVRELEPTGFGTLLAHVPPAAARPAARIEAPAKQAPPERREPDDRAAVTRLREAKAALSAAESQGRHARSRWEQTRHGLEKARQAVEKAESDAERARASVDEAQRDVAQARGAVEEAQRDLDRLHGRKAADLS